MRTFKAVILNIFYPGTGYLYLKDDFRKTIAKFLIFAWTFLLCGVIYEIIEALVMGSSYFFNWENQQVPLLAVAMWGFMVYDTFKLARSQKAIKPSLLTWDIYEVTTQKTEIRGVMLRGRIRKLGLEEGFNVLCENATDKENCVRFAVISAKNADAVEKYLKSIIPDAQITLVMRQITNPVLSKLKVNKEERYTLNETKSDKDS